MNKLIKLSTKVSVLSAIAFSALFVANFAYAENVAIIFGNNISRAQAAVVLKNNLQLPTNSCGVPFTDISNLSSTERGAIQDLYQAGITIGCGNNMYCPNLDIFRNEAAVFLNRVSNFWNGSSLNYWVSPFTDLPLTTYVDKAFFYLVNSAYSKMPQIGNPPSFDPWGHLQPSEYSSWMSYAANQNISSSNKILTTEPLTASPFKIQGTVASGLINQNIISGVSVKINCNNWVNATLNGNTWSVPSIYSSMLNPVGQNNIIYIRLNGKDMNNYGDVGLTITTIWREFVTEQTQQVINPTVTLTANPTTITSGQSSTLVWGSSNANSCTVNWPGSSGLSGTQAVYPTVTTTYNITCYGASGTTPATASAVVTVNQVQVQNPTVTITANPLSVNYNGTSIVSWNSQNATSCAGSAGSNGWTGSKNLSGTFPTGALTNSTTYIITCYGANNTSANSSVTVNVGGQQNITPTVNLYANPTSIQNGQSSTLTWNSQNANSCSAYWTGNTSTNGSGVVVPNVTTTYTITCTSATGQQAIAQATVYVNQVQNQTCQDPSANNYGGQLPCTYYNQVCQDVNAINYRGSLPCRYNTYNAMPTVGISANSTNLSYKGSTTIRWYTTNATSCYASDGSFGWAGVKSIGPGSFYTGSLTSSKVYTITCTNAYGSATDSVRVNVRGQVINPVTPVAPTSYVIINSSVDRNQPIVPTIDNTRPHPGDQINYTVSYQNIGNASITGLTLRITLPYEVDYMFSTPNNPVITGNVLTFNLGTLKANGQGSVTVRVRVKDNTPLGTVLNFPAVLSYTDPSGNIQSVSANVTAQVWSGDVNTDNNGNIINRNTDNNINLGANVFGAGFWPSNLFGWLLLIVLILLLILIAKYLFGGNTTRRTTTVTTH